MTPKRVNGRPKISWNASRRRRAVRLYLLTDLNVPNIRDALGEEGFHPGTRNLQTQLGALLPDYSKEWRACRPSKVQMRNRIYQLKKSRENRISKYQGRKYGHVIHNFKYSVCGNPKAIEQGSIQTGIKSSTTNEQENAVTSSLSSDPSPEQGPISRGPSMRSITSVKTLSSRLSSPLSSLRHVASVVSSISWRSSILYAPSGSSSRVSNRSHVPWTRDDFKSWNDFVDVSMIESPSGPLPADDERSLYSRPCCNFGRGGSVEENAPCVSCGFSVMQRRARFNRTQKVTSINATEVDLFGNTPLHHAAAAGNTTRVLELMSFTDRPSQTNSQQNTCGETFLHVLRIRGSSHFAEYEKILRKASNLGFPFGIVDHGGRSVPDRLNELLEYWEISQLKLDVVLSILSIQEKLKCRNGELQLSDFSLSWRMYRESRREETTLISTLNAWCEEKKTTAELESIIKGSNIHIRDKKGYTPLAIASALGLWDAVSLLLELRANPNTRSYHQTSLMENSAIHLARAQKEDNNVLYASILKCMALLSDHGGKAIVTVYDEYQLPSKTDKFRNGTIRTVISKTRKALVKTRKPTRVSRYGEKRLAPTGQEEQKSTRPKFAEPNLVSTGGTNVYGLEQALGIQMNGLPRDFSAPEGPVETPIQSKTQHNIGSKSSEKFTNSLPIVTGRWFSPESLNALNNQVSNTDEFSPAPLSMGIKDFNNDLSETKEASQTPLVETSFSFPIVNIDSEFLRVGSAVWACHCGFKIAGENTQHRAFNIRRHHDHCLTVEGRFPCNYPGCYKTCTHERASASQSFLQQLDGLQKTDKDEKNANARIVGDTPKTYTPPTTSNGGFQASTPWINIDEAPINRFQEEPPPTTSQSTLCSSNFRNSSPALTTIPEITSYTSLPDSKSYSQKPPQSLSSYGNLQISQSSNQKEIPTRSIKRKPKQPSFASARYMSPIYLQSRTTHIERDNESRKYSSPDGINHPTPMPTTSDHAKRRRMDSQENTNQNADYAPVQTDVPETPREARQQQENNFSFLPPVRRVSTFGIGFGPSKKQLSRFPMDDEDHQLNTQAITHDFGTNDIYFSNHEPPSTSLNLYEPQHTAEFPMATREDGSENPNQGLLYSPIPLYYELLQHLERP